MFAYFRVIAFLAPLAVMTGCASILVEPTWDDPEVVPTGWMADYDYQSGIKAYLRHQFDGALLEGASAYVYVYSDEVRHCRRIRELMAVDVVAAAFRDVRITMLNHERLKWLHTQTIGLAFDPGDWRPSMLKITANGDLAGPRYYPDLYLYHRDRLPQSQYRLTRGGGPRSVAGFAEAMRQYFQATNEI